MGLVKISEQDFSVLSNPPSGTVYYGADSVDGKAKIKKSDGTVIVLDDINSIKTIEVLTGNYTITSSDTNKIFFADSSLNLTLPNGLPAGVEFELWNATAGNEVIVKSDGTLLEKESKFAVLGNYGKVSVVHRGGNTWVMNGDTVSDDIPLQIPGLQMWIDFSDNAEITLDGSTIRRVNDKSPGGLRSIENLVISEQAQQIVGGQNALSVARFNSSIYEIPSSIIPILQSDFTLYVAFKDIASNTNKNVLSTFSGTTYVNGIRTNGNDKYRTYSKATTGTNDIGNTTDRQLPHSYRVSRSGSVVSNEYFRTGKVDSANTNTGSDVSDTVAFLGARSDAATDAFNGEIYEILIYERALNSTELASLNNYLISKWGL